MRHNNTLTRDGAALLVVDMQEKLVPAQEEIDAVQANIIKLIEVAKILGLPVIATEQYVKGLGPTVEPIRTAVEEWKPIQKNTFSCFLTPEFADRLAELQVRQLIVTGIESHICVNQTVHDALARKIQAHVVMDAVTSRTPFNRQIGFEKMQRAGAVLTSTETVIFELLERAGTPEFKAALKFLK